MGWKNVMNLLKQGGRSGKAVSKASLKDGMKDPTEVGRKTGASEARYKDMEGNVFKDKEAKEAESKRRQESIPMGHDAQERVQDAQEYESDHQAKTDEESETQKEIKLLRKEFAKAMRLRAQSKRPIAKDDEPQVER